MFDIVFRTIIIYFFILVIVRAMGKRGIGQLSPFDLVVAIMIAELAVMPIESSEMPLMHAFIPLLLLVFLEIALSFIALKSHVVRRFLDGRPQVIIENGRILRKEMMKSRYNIDDLMTQLREKGYPNVEDVEFAVLETSGRLSVVPKAQKRPLTPLDLGIQAGRDGLPVVLVMDGVIIHEGLDMCGMDEERLKKVLKAKGYDINDVFLALFGVDGEVSVFSRKAGN